MKTAYRARAPIVSALLLLPIMGCATKTAGPVKQSFEYVAPRTPAAPPLDLPALQIMLTQMGYDPVETSDKTGLTADVDGDNLTYSTVFSPLPDTSMLLVTTDLVTYTAVQLKQVNLISLLEQSGSDDLYFSMVKDGDGEILYGNDEIPMSGLTALSLRVDLSAWAGGMDNSQNIWDPKAWQ